MTNSLIQPADHDKAVTAAVAAVGTGNALAAAIGVRPSAVSNWRKTGIPPARVPLVSRLTGLPPQELRPDLWAQNDNAPEPPPGGAAAKHPAQRAA